MTAHAKQGRDPFAVAKDEVLMALVKEGNAGEAAIRLVVTLLIRFASRKEFETTGKLVAWPSQRLLAQETGMFRGRIDRAAKTVERIGFMTVDRPEKRGATHHNRYVLHLPNGRTGEANPEDVIGRTTVTNSIGRTDEANHRDADAVIGLTGEAAMASRIGPKPLDKPLDGRRALARAPANSTSAVACVIEQNNISDTDAVQKRAGSAHEGPTVASAAEPKEPAADVPAIASDHESPATRPFAPVPEDAAMIPVCVDPDMGDDRDHDADAVTLVDLIAAADDEAAALMMRAASDAADALWRLHGDDIGDVDSYAANFMAGAMGDDEAAGRAARVAAKLLMAMMDAGMKGAARDMWNDHAVILTSALSGCMPCAEAQAAVKKFNEAVGVAGRDLAARRNAAQAGEAQIEEQSNG